LEKEPMRVLVIEDDAMLGHGLCNSIADAGIDTSWADNGKSGLELLEAGDYDVALLDLGLPGLDGRCVLDAVQHLGLCTPVVVMTANDGPHIRAECLLLGAADFIGKPFGVPKILACVGALARQQTSTFRATIGGQSNLTPCHANWRTLAALPC
jgi:DNA-binding response OmpR family regulator